jgi:hypothetical protein
MISVAAGRLIKALRASLAHAVGRLAGNSMLALFDVLADAAEDVQQPASACVARELIGVHRFCAGTVIPPRRF